jgi:hypothetical protein
MKTAEQPARRHVGRGSLVTDHGVDQLMVGERVDTLTGAERFERQHRRCHVDEDAIARRAEDRRGIAAVAEVLQQDGDLAVGLVAEPGLLRVQAVEKTLRHVRREVTAGRVEVDDLQLIGLDDLEVLCTRRCRGTRAAERGNQERPRTRPRLMHRCSRDCRGSRSCAAVPPPTEKADPP